MRLVKRTVNQDDTSAYHLFYGDGVASPGSDVTFFDWDVPRERRGTHSIARTALRVTGEPALRYWDERFRRLGVSAGDVIERDGRLSLDFEDPEGQRFCLVDDAGAGDPSVPYSKSPVPPEHQIRGLGPITLSVPQLRSTEEILTRVMNMKQVREYGNTHVFQMSEGGAHAELHVAVEPKLPIANHGAGGVHHVAFRTPDVAQYLEWEKHLNESGVRNSGQVDRYYFRSLYFREPNGILFEIATDGPGFGVDENMETLGESVSLPPFLEPQREEILANLEPID
jgi:glyoxalase family protein